MAAGVAMVASVFYPSVGGIQTHTLRLSQKLRARGLDVFVLTRHAPGLSRYEELAGLPVYRVGTSVLGKAVEAISYIEEGFQLLARQGHRVGVVHAHQMLSPMTLGLMARRMLGQRLLINPHAAGPGGDVHLLREERPWSGRFRLAAARQWGDAFVSISPQIHAELRSVGVPEDRIWSLPNGVDTDHFRPLGSPERAAQRRQLGFPEGPWAVFTGRLSPQKGLEVLLRAWPQVLAHSPRAQLILVGEGESRPALESLSSSLGILQSVHWVGTRADVAPYLQAADVYVFPSRGEGMPVALLEALAVGVPVVATNVPGVRDLVSPEALVPLDVPDRLATGVLHALDPGRGSRGAQARAQVMERFALDAVADRYVELYENLLTHATGTKALPAV
jgi:glycosyltransferase involved in cell wall biosynthesis